MTLTLPLARMLSTSLFLVVQEKKAAHQEALNFHHLLLLPNPVASVLLRSSFVQIITLRDSSSSPVVYHICQGSLLIHLQFL
mmetsp:Transcript_23434/g.38065  ORF Transcript_23434/g.38065 Transcript_23434/m.38065 type:complete len:82 (-) Transcript_23434:144-389(-)